MFPVAVLLLLAAGSYVKCETLTQPASVTVQPGQPLTISCQVSYSVSSYATHWIRQPAGKGLEWIGYKYTGGTSVKDSLKNKFSIELDTSSKTLTLKGQNMQPGDTAVYYCARAPLITWSPPYYFDYWGQGTQVTVTSATSTKPTVFPLMPCGSGTGTTVTLGCLATGFSPSSLTYAWNKNGAALPGSIQYPPVLKGEHYTGVSQIVVPKLDWEASKPGQYKCSVTHAAGNGEAFFQKKVVVYKTPELKVSAFSDEENKVSFICTATDFSPKDHQIKWLKNKKEVTDKISEFETKKSGSGTALYSVASILTMQSADVPALTEITCQFKGKNETGDVFTRDFLSYSPGGPTSTECPKADVEVSIEPPKSEDILVEKKGTIICHVKANKPRVLKIYWEDQNGDEIAGAYMEPKNGETTHSLPLGITYVEWSQGIKFICVVIHSEVIDPIKTPYERKTGVLTQRPSVFMMPPVEHIKKNMVTLTCFVKDFSPEEVFVSWLVDDELTTDDFNTTKPIKNHESYSAYGQLSLSLDQWKQAGSVYSCVVYHQSLDSNTRAIVRSIAYNTFDKLNLVNVSLNIPNTCKA